MTIDNSNIPTTNEVNLTKDIETGEKFLNQYKLLSKLGNGHNGKVYLAQNTENDEYYAVKEISKISKISILNKNPNDQKNKINNEINVMKTIIKHPKILKLHEILDDGKFNKIFLILEYCPKGELKFGPAYSYSLSFLKLIIRDIVLGLEYLNGVGIIHRDIKPSNLLMNNDNFIKISDFGISLNKFDIDTDGHKNLKTNSNFGTPAFSPPELCNGSNFNKIDPKCDIWSLGITIYCLYYQKLPFNGNNEYELFNEIINKDLIFPKDDDPEAKVLNDLISKMLNKNPAKRYNIHDVKSHEFLNSDLDADSKKQFLKFNEYYLFKRESNVGSFAKNSSNTTLNKFKSIFIRKSSMSKHTNQNQLASTCSLPVDNKLEKEISNHTPIANSSISTLQDPNSSSTISPSTTASSPPHIILPQQRPPLAPSQKTTSASLLKRPPLRSSSNQLASSTNSLNLNSLLRSKKEVPNYLDDSTFFQSVDSDYSSDDSSDNSNDDDDKLLYNDVEDTLSIRIGPKRQQSSLQVKTVNEYLGI